MNVNFCGIGTNLGRLRIFLAGAALLAVGCLILGSGSRSRQSAQQPNSTPNVAVSLQNAALASPPASTSQRVPALLKNRALASYRSLPIMFEPNVGQIDMARKQQGLESAERNLGVKFLAHGTGYSLFLTADGTVMSLRSRESRSRSEALRMKLVGANPAARVSGAEQLPGKTSYFIGNNAAEWRRAIPQFARVRYDEIYPGINLVFYGREGQLEYDFQVAPGSDPAQAQLQFDGSKKLQLSHGNLIIKGRGGDVRLETPRAYQQIAGHEQPVESHFVLRAGNRVGFEIGPYDHSRELVIDPILSYSTYFGGTADETCPSFVTPVPAMPATATPGCPAIAIDNVADIYLVGATDSNPATFPAPATGGLVPPSTNSNIYVAKLDPTGGTLLYLAFLGGGGTDVNAGVAVDGSGNVYLAGTTTSGINGSASFPTTTTAYQTAPETGSAGTSHVFVTLLNSGGSSLGYSSYLSGNGTDIASGMTIDSKGDIFVTGTTTSSDAGTTSIQFPASAPPQPQGFQISSRAPVQFFVTKVNTAASLIGSILYSTYFGGGTPSNGVAIGGGIAVDSTGDIYFSGTTSFLYTGQSPTTDFPILNAYQPCLNTAPPAVNTNPQTCSTTATPDTDGFVAKLNPALPTGTGQLVWSTYFGGTSDDSVTAITLDSGAANVYVTGVTNSQTIVPAGTAIAFQAFQNCLDVYPNQANTSTCAAPANPSATDGFVARLSNPASGLQTLTYFSYLGGSGNDGALAITVDSASGALVTGYTQSTDFPVLPTPSPIQSNLKGPQDAFLARLNTQAVTGQTTGSYSTYFGGSGTDTGTSIVLDSNLNTYVGGTTNSADFPTAASLQGSLSGGYDAFASRFGTSADLQITGLLSLGTGQTYISAGNQATFTYTVTNNGPDLATNVTVTDNINPAFTGVPLTFTSATASSGTCSAPSANTVPVVCTISSLQAGATATVTMVLVPTIAGNFNGGAVVVSSTNNNDPNPANNTVTVSGRASDFTLNVQPANQSVPAAGDTAVYTVVLAPQPVFGASVSLSCGDTPTGSACAFQPSGTITLNATPFAATMNVSTTARPVTTTSNQSWPRHFYAIFLSIPALSLVGFGARKGHRARAILGILMAGLLVGLIAIQPACSGATTPPTVAGTPPGTHTITLTATSGTNTKNQTFTLSVP